MIRETRRRYYGQMSQIDYHLGRLFGALQTRGLDQNTAIVFTSDHGECLGDHGLFHKHCFLESAARVPLIMRLPGSAGLPSADQSDAPVLTADIPSTLLDLVGLRPDEKAEGLSLVPLMKSPEAFQQRVIFGETPDTTSAIDKEFKYIFYRAGGAEQLFNTKQDPDDRVNLVADPAHAGHVSRLKSKLLEYLRGKNSPFVNKDTWSATSADFDAAQERALNPLACRGPMRGGTGY